MSEDGEVTRLFEDAVCDKIQWDRNHAIGYGEVLHSEQDEHKNDKNIVEALHNQAGQPKVVVRYFPSAYGVGSDRILSWPRLDLQVAIAKQGRGVTVCHDLRTLLVREAFKHQQDWFDTEDLTMEELETMYHSPLTVDRDNADIYLLKTKILQTNNPVLRTKYTNGGSLIDVQPKIAIGLWCKLGYWVNQKQLPITFGPSFTVTTIELPDKQEQKQVTAPEPSRRATPPPPPQPKDKKEESKTITIPLKKRSRDESPAPAAKRRSVSTKKT